ncbi:MAG: hypothetical protein WC564_01755 [Patescibacteria group bacterium]
MKNIWSILCQESSVDSNTNKISLFNCIDELTMSFARREEINDKPKNIPLSFDLVSLWTKEIDEPDNFNILIQFFDPNGKELKSFEQDISFERGKKRLRAIIKVNGFVITSDGTYKIKLSYKQNDDDKYKPFSELPFDVIFVFQEKI